MADRVLTDSSSPLLNIDDVLRDVSDCRLDRIDHARIELEGVAGRLGVRRTSLLTSPCS
jgi:hypothetical protein